MTNKNPWEFTPIHIFKISKKLYFCAAYIFKNMTMYLWKHALILKKMTTQQLQNNLFFYTIITPLSTVIESFTKFYKYNSSLFFLLYIISLILLYAIMQLIKVIKIIIQKSKIVNLESNKYFYYFLFLESKKIVPLLSKNY